MAPHRGWTPREGVVEATVSACPDPGFLTAVWLVGVEDASPDDSGEITVAELFGDRVGPAASTVRCGVKAVNDPRLVTDLADVDLPVDATRPHRYAAAWGEEGVGLYVDGRLVHAVGQTLRYPLQLLVDLFELPGLDGDAGPRDPAAYPRTARVHEVRAWRSPPRPSLPG
ncbi:family 16 glycosylhydrolase [Xylanimonas protaetiae]|uniref:Glycosyl hydrolase family protein n=1 Tax=Xylanimonas protaetiae TaxID=2509457 RepID=A0A4P6F5L8_9MICO|nr:family 16 glycosylhydrolase [Xylanimonas protaetiae]QAY70665.1 glycosyl hydrolase family protein [Xylanimonas protaetiae]